jgi:hypothetical protein
MRLWGSDEEILPRPNCLGKVGFVFALAFVSDVLLLIQVPALLLVFSAEGRGIKDKR